MLLLLIFGCSFHVNDTRFQLKISINAMEIFQTFADGKDEVNSWFDNLLDPSYLL